MGDIVIRPDSTEAYTLATKGYWTYIAEAIQPSCVVSVKTVEDVSAAVALLTKEQCKFAVRSGGHSPWGSSNIADGVVISLSSLNQITVSEDRKVTRLGTGNRWGDVYLKLDTLGLAVPGGRVANVGVGGLITGGGISFFSPRYGFVCDNVVNFEVVLSSGEVVNANAEENSDLLKALKGSGNNLGVITAFDIKTFEQGKFVGGTFTSLSLGDSHLQPNYTGFMGNPISTTEETISALVDLAAHENYDPYAALIQSYVYYPIDAEGNRDWLIMSNVEYTATVEAKDIPDVSAIFQPLMDIKPQVYSTVRISNLSDFAIEINNSNPPGQRALFFTTSFAVEKQLLLDVVALTKEKAETLKNVAGLIWALTFQPLPRAFTKWGAANGGNILGLDGSEDQIGTCHPFNPTQNPQHNSSLTNEQTQSAS